MSLCASTSGPFNGGAPCGNEPGDVQTSSCDGGEASTPCLCSANDFVQADGSNPFFDASTVVTCGACDAVNNGQPCYLTCAQSAAGNKYVGDASISCMQGTWTLPQTLPSCGAGVQRCPLIPEDETLGYVPGGVCDGAELGDVCMAYCNPGWILAPYAQPTATCLADGQWSAPILCIQVDQNVAACPPIEQGGTLTYAPGSTFDCFKAGLGATCSVTCVAGYIIPSGSYGSATCGPLGSWTAVIECSLSS